MTVGKCTKETWGLSVELTKTISQLDRRMSDLFGDVWEGLFSSLWDGDLHVDLFRVRVEVDGDVSVAAFKWITWTEIVLHLVVFVYRQIIDKPTPEIGGKRAWVEGWGWVYNNKKGVFNQIVE